MRVINPLLDALFELVIQHLTTLQRFDHIVVFGAFNRPSRRCFNFLVATLDWTAHACLLILFFGLVHL
jgi:hypothetical protein